MADLGIIGPIYGRWYWPFKQMEEGDFFHVRYEDRAPEAVRQMGSVRAAQIGIRISVNKDDARGLTRVEKVPFASPDKALPKELDYQQMNALLRRQYDIEAEDVSWHGAINKGDQIRKSAVRIEPDARSSVRVDIGRQRFEVKLNPDGLVATLIKEVEISEELKALLAGADKTPRYTFLAPSAIEDEEMKRLMS